MTDSLPASFVAINREASLAAEHIAIGATALGYANYASPARYSEAFFALSVGFERSCKLAVAIDSLVSDGRYPTSKELRAYGHRLGDLLASVDNIALARGFQSHLPRSPITTAIVNSLGAFASNVTRYYNLELLGSGTTGLNVGDPLATWHQDVTGAVLDSHYSTERRQRDDAQAALGGRLMGPLTSVHYISEAGTSIRTVEDSMRATRQAVAARPWERMYVLQVGRFLGSTLGDLARSAHAQSFDIPYVQEHFAIFNQADRYFRERKTWSTIAR